MKKKKSELTGLTRQTLDSYRESLITKYKKKWQVNTKLTGLTRQTRLTRQIRDPCHESLITKLNKKN